MADDIDRAQELERLNLEASLAAHRAAAAATPKLQPEGYCLNPRCGDDFEPRDCARLFCGPACEAEHSRLTRQAR